MYRHSISIRAALLQRRVNPSFSHLLLDDEDSKRKTPSPPQTNPISQPKFTHRDTYFSSNSSVSSGFSGLFRERRGFGLPLSLGFEQSSLRMYSSSIIGEGGEKIEYMSDVAEVLTEKSVEVAVSNAPVVSEVAIAAADSFFPVAALQYLIDGVHSFTGLNWWAAIALTTFMIRGATVPLLVNQLKATYKLTQIRPEMEEIRQQMQDSLDPQAVKDGQKRMKAIFAKHGVNPFTPLKGLFIQGPIFISFFMAITNMAEKVPSFKGGGAFWFLDLTTPDDLYIFPVLTSLTFLATVELNMQEGMEGNPVAGTVKNFSRILAVLTIPFTMSFPKAIFCYWVTSNMFSLVYGQVIRRPRVKKFLGLPEIVPQDTTSPQPSFSSLFGFKPAAPAASPVPVEQSKPASPMPLEQSKLPDRRISSSAVISQRIKNLEKAVKGRKKKTKR